MSNILTKRIYYIGGLNLPPGEENNFFIKSGQEVFVCPPVGEFIDVPEYVARDIMKNYGFDVFTDNQHLASRVASGKAKFERVESNGKVEIREVLSDEEILARAEAIRARMESEADDSGDSKDEGEKGDDAEEEPKKKTTRSRKTKKKVEE